MFDWKNLEHPGWMCLSRANSRNRTSKVKQSPTDAHDSRGPNSGAAGVVAVEAVAGHVEGERLVLGDRQVQRPQRLPGRGARLEERLQLLGPFPAERGRGPPPTGKTGVRPPSGLAGGGGHADQQIFDPPKRPNGPFWTRTHRMRASALKPCHTARNASSVSSSSPQEKYPSERMPISRISESPTLDSLQRMMACACRPGGCRCVLGDCSGVWFPSDWKMPVSKPVHKEYQLMASPVPN